jgi:hypothetical protein
MCASINSLSINVPGELYDGDKTGRKERKQRVDAISYLGSCQDTYREITVYRSSRMNLLIGTFEASLCDN